MGITKRSAGRLISERTPSSSQSSGTFPNNFSGLACCGSALPERMGCAYFFCSPSVFPFFRSLFWCLQSTEAKKAQTKEEVRSLVTAVEALSVDGVRQLEKRDDYV